MPYLCSPKVTKNMARQDIRYGGYATTPNDRDCPDGPLATSINLVNEDGALQPLIEPEDLFTLPAGYKLWCIHATAVFKHYIVETATHELAWIDENSLSNVTTIYNGFDDNYQPITLDFNNISDITTVGNTLCLLDNDGLHYILWQADNNGYTYLGQKPEMIELSFGLSDNKLADYIGNQYGNSPGNTNYAMCYTSHFFKVNCSIDNVQKKINITLSETGQGYLLEELWATINKANALISKQGHFYAPFFVRYAYRLYDGNTLWMHSAPVFLPVSMPLGYNADIAHAVVDANDNISINASSDENLGLNYFPQNVALTCKAISGDIDRLKNEWGDIIKSIDIFVSLPMIREKSNENIHSATLAGWSPNIYTQPERPKTRHLRDGDLWIQNGEMIVNGTSTGAQKRVFLDIPLLSMERYQEKICDVSNFYKVASYNLANDTIPTTSYEEVKIGEDVLTSLATQEVMTDDYKTHNKITPIVNGTECITHLFNNNKRLIVTAPQEILFDGFPACSIVPYCGDNITIKKIFVRLKTEVGERVVGWSDDTGYLSNRVVTFCQPLFYPDNRAYEIEVYFTYIDELLQRVAYGKYVRTMNPCAMLNGAFTDVGDYVTISYPSEWGTVPTPSYLVPYPYKLYSSDVNNPFIFPSTGINSVGSGSITGIATVNEPVSTGQFGYSDIYIFTTDGLWVAKIGSDGGLTSIQPVKADVCISPESITQLSGSVLFATARGIMEVVGNQTVCISDILNGDLLVSPHTLPHADELHQLLGHSDTSCLNPAPFLEYVQGCRMIYDYTHQRIVVFNPTIEDGERKYTYAYVYSLKSKLWGMMYSDLSYGFNSYPDAMAVVEGDEVNNVVTLSGSDTVFEKQMIITRPLKLGATDTLKSIRNLIQRGVFERGDVNTVLYGSRDLINWHLIGSSTYHDLRNLRGTGYKYFRIASVTSLAKGESLSCVTIEAVPKHTNLLI